MLDGMPNLTQREIDDTYEVIKTLTDPEKAKGWFNDLIIAKKRASDAAEAAQIEQRKATQMVADAAEQRAAAERITKRATDEIATTRDRLAKQQAFVEMRLAELAAKETKFDKEIGAREDALRIAMADLAKRESTIDAREATASDKEAAATITLRTLNGKLQELRRIVN